jgi:hypothetical protein
MQKAQIQNIHIFCVNFQKRQTSTNVENSGKFNKRIMATATGQAILELQKIVGQFFNIHSIHWVGIK